MDRTTPSLDDATLAAHATIRRHSKSFALAARLLPRRVADDAVVLYAYCRAADDAVDTCTPSEQPARLQKLRVDLDRLYAPQAAGHKPSAFRALIDRRRIPRAYFDELLAGMEMDVTAFRYASMRDLRRYAFRVAGTVGLMMCHVMGIRREEALVHAAHLGMGMQLTNIARDVFEDWERGRLYLPRDLLAVHGAAALETSIGRPFPIEASAAVARATAALLEHADAYYASGDAGMRDLSFRCAFAVRTARRVYASIGDRVRSQSCDPRAGRAVVPGTRKMALALRAATETVASVGERLLGGHPRVPRGSIDTEVVLAELPLRHSAGRERP